MADLSELETNIRTHAQQVIERAADVMVELVRENAPYRSGELWNSIGREDVRDDGNSLTCPVYADAKQAAFVEYGTTAHWISPTQPHGLLVFEADGGTVFVHGSVWHPGTTANPFFSQTIERNWSLLLEWAIGEVG